MAIVPKRLTWLSPGEKLEWDTSPPHETDHLFTYGLSRDNVDMVLYEFAPGRFEIRMGFSLPGVSFHHGVFDSMDTAKGYAECLAGLLVHTYLTDEQTPKQITWLPTGEEPPTYLDFGRWGPGYTFGTVNDTSRVYVWETREGKFVAHLGFIRHGRSPKTEFVSLLEAQVFAMTAWQEYVNSLLEIV